MIAIPNMDKPQNCQECPAHTFNYGYIPGDNGCRILKRAFNIDKLDINPFNEVLPDCPLIEIVRCGECKHRDPEDKKCDCGMFERQGCIFPVADDYFCKYGERRSE